MNVQLAICAVGPIFIVAIYTVLKGWATSFRRWNELRKGISQQTGIDRR